MQNTSRKLQADPDLSVTEVGYVPEQYQHESIKGCRLAGWEDLNIVRFSEDIGIGVQHLRQVLTGRAGCSMYTANRIATHLGMTIDTLVKRIGRAQTIDRDRIKLKSFRQ